MAAVTDLRKLARGEPCLVRLPGICNGDPATTVLAHYRLIGVSGMGLRSPDLIASWSCSSCHDEIDRRTQIMQTSAAKLAHAEGCFRTINELIRRGLIA